eukprot:GFUD01075481.1.p1 GENE.GFUD01075481.1~~GFUD01075481.1.p1  ORF type:complete len:113 (-),score=48.41 GFUD01075481.1:142-480(-)
MMTGNIQGYEDINSQRKVENNYKFSWSENLVDDIEKKIEGLGGEEYISHGEGNIKHQNEPEEIALTDSGNNVIDIYATAQTNENVGGEMIIDDEIFTDSDEEDEDDQNKDEL